MSENVQTSHKTLFVGISSVAVLAILGAAVWLFVLPVLGVDTPGGLVNSNFDQLNTETPAIFHPDGIVVSLQADSEPVDIQLKSQPREQFLSGQAGPAWADALANLPPNLRLLSPIYTIQTRNAPAGRLFAEMNIPNGAEPLETLSLYAWDPATLLWTFVPSQQDILRDVIGFSPTQTLTHIAATQTDNTSPQIGLVLLPGTTVDTTLAQQVTIALPTGVTILSDASLSGAPVPNNAIPNATTSPLISNIDFDSGTGYLNFSDPGLNQIALNNLASLAANFDGLALDFSVPTDQRDTFSTFVQEMQTRLHSQNKTLSLVINGTTLTPYNLPLLGQTADQIWWTPGDDPSLYLDGGIVQNALYTLVGNIDRNKLGMLVSADSVDISVSPSSITPLTTEQALSRFGQITAIDGYLNEDNSIFPGEEIPFRLTGSLQALSYDVNLGANFLAYAADDGQLHYIYLSSAEGLSRKLRWASAYNLNTIIVKSAADQLAIDSVSNGLLAFTSQAPAPSPSALNITWQVTDSDSQLLSETSGDLSAIQFLWQAEPEPGDYVISAQVGGQTSSTLGALEIAVVEPPAPEPVIQTVASADGTTQPGVAPVVTAGGAAVGGFELGGQARDTGNASLMHSAGMSWIKYQIRSVGDVGGVAGAVAQGHAAGFKVLVTIIDPGWNHSDYGFFASFMADVAAQGPDAIEVWNEMNLSREWPADQIGGANYVNNMLAPAFNAIKSVNPNIMVISGAPSPTGAFGGCPAPSPIPGEAGCNDDEFLRQMAAAGGANFMDCVGVHFNAGATSPYSNSGHPGGGHYSWYLQPMINLYSGTLGKPLCFTELGYVIGGNLGGGPFAWANATTTEQHAQWLAEAATLSAQSGRVRLMIVWNISGYSGDPTYDPQGEYSIVRPGGGCPACTTLGQAMGVQ